MFINESTTRVATCSRAALSHSRPYPWPFDAAFAGSRCALLVLDTANPTTDDSDGDGVWPVVRMLAAEVAQTGGLVIDLHSHRPARRGSTIAEGTPARRLATANYHLDSPGWDAFYGTELDQRLRAAGRDLVLLCGAWLEVGIHSTMRSANDREYECLLVADGCLADAQETRAGALSSIEKSGGVFGAVGRSADLFALLVSSAHGNHATRYACRGAGRDNQDGALNGRV